MKCDEVAHGAVTPVKEVHGILFAGQGRCMRRSNDFGKRLSAAKGSSITQRFDPLSLMGCFNCDDRSDSLGDLLHPVYADKDAEQKLEYYAEKRAAQPAARAVVY